MPRKNKQGVSARWLEHNWRLAVFAKHRHICAVCGEPIGNPHDAEAHHVVYRRQSALLKYDAENGVPVHVVPRTDLVPGQTMTCHQFAHTRAGEERLKAVVDWEYLLEWSPVNKKDYLLRHSLTDAEWRREQLRKLKGAKTQEGIYARS